MAKRGNNEGSIFRRRSDGLYVAALTLPDGKRKRFYGRTRAGAAEKLSTAQADLAKGLPLPSERLTVAAFLDRWLEDARSTIRETTYDGYESTLRLHAKPEIGRIALSRLGPQDLAALYRKLLTEGLSPRSVRLAHAVLHRALRQAERWGLIARNPAGLVDAPRPSNTIMSPLTPDEIRRLLRAAAGDRFEALYVLAVTTGLRSGELRGLRWQDVNLVAGTLQVRQQVQRTAKGWAFVEPKTGAGRRGVTLPTVAVGALRGHRARQNEERLARGPVWEDLDLVFPNELGRPVERQNLQRRSFDPLLERAGLSKIRFHDLRHSAATLLLAEGVHPKVVQERLGHSNISVTMDIYSHVLPTMQREAASKLDRFFEASAGGLVQ
ncbi:MAG: tyrosine-type recombinase/integrase [Chloroflexi bacterium]|nr:tyrosine-type recombinase/integrase [Chloroflexota bacterium]